MKKQDKKELLAAVKKDGKWGFVDANGNLAIDCTLYDVKRFENGLAVVELEEKDGWQYLDRYGELHQRKEHFAPDGEVRGPFNEGIAKEGYFEVHEHTEKKTVYDNVADFEGHTEYETTYTTVFIHGYIDENGKWLTKCDYRSSSPEWISDEISEGIIRMHDKRWCLTEFMDKTGKRLPGAYSDAKSNFHDGMVRAKTGLFITKYAFMNTKGEIVFKKRCAYAGDFSEGLVWVKEKGGYTRFSYLDKKGNTVIGPCFWQDCGDFHEGLARVLLDGKYGLWGYIDQSGKYAIPCQWDCCGDFYDGLARVKKDGLWGYIDRTGKPVIPCQWDDSRDFHEGVAWVKKDGLWGCIDRTGKLVIPRQWDSLGDFRNGVAKAEKDGLWGCVDVHGETVVPCVWDSLLMWDSWQYTW